MILWNLQIPEISRSSLGNAQTSIPKLHQKKFKKVALDWKLHSKHLIKFYLRCFPSEWMPVPRSSRNYSSCFKIPAAICEWRRNYSTTFSFQIHRGFIHQDTSHFINVIYFCVTSSQVFSKLFSCTENRGKTLFCLLVLHMELGENLHRILNCTACVTVLIRMR